LLSSPASASRWLWSPLHRQEPTPQRSSLFRPLWRAIASSLDSWKQPGGFEQRADPSPTSYLCGLPGARWTVLGRRQRPLAGPSGRRAGNLARPSSGCSGSLRPGQRRASYPTSPARPATITSSLCPASYSDEPLTAPGRQQRADDGQPLLPALQDRLDRGIKRPGKLQATAYNLVDEGKPTFDLTDLPLVVPLGFTPVYP
jgi:hypothetical protein